MPNEKSNEGLKRIVGVPELAASVVNFSIGGSIYAIPAIIGIQLGISSLIGYLLCGLMFVAIILCYIEIGKQVKATGGSYAYVEAAFGPFAGFVVNWLFFLGWAIISDAAVINIVADSLATKFPAFADPAVRAFFFLIMILLMIFLNVFDNKKSVQVVKYTTVIKMIPLVVLIITGFFYIDFSNFHMSGFPTLDDFNQSAIILFFAFAGFETSLNVSGEIKNPERTLPRALLYGGIIVFIIYVLVQIIAIGILGSRLDEFKSAPLAAIAEIIAGIPGITIIIFSVVVSGLASINGDIFSSSRLLFAGARDGLFPGFLGKIHPKNHTPYPAVITFGLLIFIFSVTGGFKQLAILASAALLLIYLAVVLASVKLKIQESKSGKIKSVLNFGLLVPGAAIAAIVYVLSSLSSREFISIGIFIGVVCIIYFFIINVRRKRVGAEIL